jgi:hypothetical protein
VSYEKLKSVAPETEGSSPHLQEPATGPYAEPTASTLRPHENKNFKIKVTNIKFTEVSRNVLY